MNPPQGYRLATKDDMDKVPPGMLILRRGAWPKSNYKVGNTVSAMDRRRQLYAVPNTQS